MSQANLAVVKEFYRRIAENPAGDFSLFADNVVWHTAHDGPSGGAVIRGVEAVRAHWAAVEEGVSEEVADPVRITDLGDDILVKEHVVATGRASGIRLESELGYIYTVIEDRITRVRCFRTYEEALRAAGRGK